MPQGLTAWLPEAFANAYQGPEWFRGTFADQEAFRTSYPTFASITTAVHEITHPPIKQAEPEPVRIPFWERLGTLDI